MKFFIATIIVTLASAVAVAGPGGWTTRVKCNNGSAIIETEDANPKHIQVVIYDRGVIDYFAEASDQFMYYKMRGAQKWLEGTNVASLSNTIDFTYQYTASGHDPLDYASLVLQRQGNGIHFNLYRVHIWGEGGIYDETIGQWRLFTAKKESRFLRNWYFANCY